MHLFVDGQRRASIAADFLALPHGDESYLSVGRDGRWQRAFPGAIDELRVSDHAVYTGDGAAPQSFSRMQGQARPAPLAGPALLFPSEKVGRGVPAEPSGQTPGPVAVEGPRLTGTVRPTQAPLDLGSRRHRFLDRALIDRGENLALTVHPARVAEPVIEGSGLVETQLAVSRDGQRTKDVSALAGRTGQLGIRMRGTSRHGKWKHRA